MERSTVLERGMDVMSDRYRSNVGQMGQVVQQMTDVIAGIAAAGGEVATARHRCVGPAMRMGSAAACSAA